MCQFCEGLRANIQLDSYSFPVVGIKLVKITGLLIYLPYKDQTKIYEILQMVIYDLEIIL